MSRAVWIGFLGLFLMGQFSSSSGQEPASSAPDAPEIVREMVPETVLEEFEDVAAAQRASVPVHVAVRVDQIVGIDQKSENFRAVFATLMRYKDPKLAYERAPDDLPFRMFTLDEFLKLVQEHETHWPEFVFSNQQGRLDVAAQLILLSPIGDVTFFERATMTFQAPDFDFRSFPFDEQIFHIRITSVLPLGFYHYEPIEGVSGMGEQLGEEEWVVEDFQTKVHEVETAVGTISSEFLFSFIAHRHLVYYVARLFIPMFIILMVSWATFQLKDYVKRIDVGITNLLLFIAFNFTVSSDLPRLGYVTAMDAFMTGAFIITGLVVLVNVAFRRMQTEGQEARVERLDRIAVWGYWPAYILGMSVALLLL